MKCLGYGVEVNKAVVQNSDSSELGAGLVKQVEILHGIEEPCAKGTYAALPDKPSINDVVLIGNKTLNDLSIEPKRGEADNYVTDAEKEALHSHENKSVLDSITALLVGGWNAAVSWIANYGQLHIESKANPHETSFSNIEGYPDTPVGKYLNDSGIFDYPNTGSGGGSQPFYMSNSNSDITGYKRLTTSPDSIEVVKNITAINGTESGEAYLFDLPFGESLLSAGAFDFSYWRAVSNTQGVSSKLIEIFARNPNGTEQAIVTFISPDINDITLTERSVTRSTTGNTVIDPLARIGVRSKLTTDRVQATTLSYVVGGVRSWMFRPPVAPRHDYLRDKNGNLDFLHLNNAQKNQGALATGNTTLTTLNQVANYVSGLTFKLIGSFTPIAGTGAFSTIYDGSGALLSSLNVKRCFIEIYATSSVSTVQVGAIRINNVFTLTYKQNANNHSGILFRNNAENYSFSTIDFTGILKYFSSSINSPTRLNDSTFANQNYQGINRTIVNGKLEQLDVVLGGGATFEANSIINIYVL